VEWAWARRTGATDAMICYGGDPLCRRRTTGSRAAAHMLRVGEQPSTFGPEICRGIHSATVVTRRAVLGDGSKAEKHFVAKARIGERLNEAIRDLIAIVSISHSTARSIEFVDRLFELIAKPRRDPRNFRNCALSNTLGQSLCLGCGASLENLETISSDPGRNRHN
jgi:hypothetical protein